MHTQCPHCNTPYEIDEVAIAKAHGQAECAKCKQVFNAFEKASASEAQPLTLNPKKQNLGLRTPYAFEDTTVEFITPAEPKKTSNHIISTLLVLLFSFSALAQITWLKRDNLLHHPVSRHYLQIACEKLDCQLPKPDAKDKFKVLKRALAPDLTREKALYLTLSFQNQAAFAQLIPYLELSFFDHNEKLQARRRFSPAEYIQPAPLKDQQMLANETLNIRLLLEDPGPQTMGFKIDFL